MNHQVAHQTRSDRQRQITCISYVHRPDAHQDAMELVMLLMIHESGQLCITEDRHHCGLFAQNTWVNLLENAGFTVQMPEAEEDIPGHLFVAVKR